MRRRAVNAWLEKEFGPPKKDLTPEQAKALRAQVKKLSDAGLEAMMKDSDFGAGRK